MELLIFWFIAAVIVGVIGQSRGRSGWGWFFLSSLLLSPLLGLILVLCLTNLRTAKLEQARYEQEQARHYELMAALAHGKTALPQPLTN